MTIVCTYPVSATRARRQICEALAATAGHIFPIAPTLKPSGHWESEVHGLNTTEVVQLRLALSATGLTLEKR